MLASCFSSRFDRCRPRLQQLALHALALPITDLSSTSYHKEMTYYRDCHCSVDSMIRRSFSGPLCWDSGWSTSEHEQSSRYEIARKITAENIAISLGEEALQLCSYPVVGSPDPPPGVFGLRSIQMASILAGGHPHGSGMVFALLAFVPRRRGAIGRAWAPGGSRHRLVLGLSGTPRSWIGACANGSRQQTTFGGWTRRTRG
jgi:hypothetical protein